MFQNSNVLYIQPMIPVTIKALGDPGTGKTSSLISYTVQTFPEWVPSVMDPIQLNWMVDGKPISFTLYDMDSSKEFDYQTFDCPQVPDIFLIFASIKNAESLFNAHKWSDQIKLYNAEHKRNIPFMLVGSMMDQRSNTGDSSFALTKEISDLIVHGFCRRYTSNEDVIGECFRFYYDKNVLFQMEQGELKAKEIGAVMYIEHSGLTQENLKFLLDSATRQALDHRNRENSKRKVKCLIQ